MVTEVENVDSKLCECHKSLYICESVYYGLCVCVYRSPFNLISSTS